MKLDAKRSLFDKTLNNFFNTNFNTNACRNDSCVQTFFHHLLPSSDANENGHGTTNLPFANVCERR